jgi:hypothetical protein
MRWPTLSALFLGFAAIFAAGNCSAEEGFYGLSVFGGGQYRSDSIWHTSENYDWREIQVRPVVGWHKTDNWDLWVEGNLGYIAWEDQTGSAEPGEESQHSLEAGVTGMTSYDVLKKGGWSLYGELGVGIGWMSNTPDPHLADNGVLGFLDYGLGVKFRTESGFAFKLGPRFHHRSCLFTRDAGMNSYFVMLSITK